MELGVTSESNLLNKSPINGFMLFLFVVSGDGIDSSPDLTNVAVFKLIFVFHFEECLYVTSGPGFVIVETVHSFKCVSTDVDVFSKAINLSVNAFNVLICLQHLIPICAFKSVP